MRGSVRVTKLNCNCSLQRQGNNNEAPADGKNTTAIRVLRPASHKDDMVAKWMAEYGKGGAVSADNFVKLARSVMKAIVFFVV